MKTPLAAALLVSTSIVYPAVSQVLPQRFEETALHTTDHNIPGTPAGGTSISGKINVWYRSSGEYNDGYVTIFATEDPYTGFPSVQLNLDNGDDSAAYLSRNCVNVYASYWWGGSDWNNIPSTLSDYWTNNDCQSLPDVRLYNTGSSMHIELLLAHDWMNYVLAVAPNAVPHNFWWYDIQIIYNLNGNGLFQYLVLQDGVTPVSGGWRNMETGNTWEGHGVVVGTPGNLSIAGMDLVVGCGSAILYGDPNASDTCVFGSMSGLFFDAAVAPVPDDTDRNKFITGLGFAADLGPAGFYPYFTIPALELDDQAPWNANPGGIGPQPLYPVGYYADWNAVYGPVYGGVTFDDPWSPH